MEIQIFLYTHVLLKIEVFPHGDQFINDSSLEVFRRCNINKLCKFRVK
jgi:hypothetical protein